ncbi:MAG TPA: bifunctional folylpolyglutamate synthase/dihydrofolate synthase [Candidatus Faecivicinus avistercoris]|nr:bifunctional folylpolyglutamate synthase/dihydrofolate synthase [Candidatus Faecivicinus avistercoris]
MNVTEALSYIHSVSWMGSVPGLGRTRALLARMGNPEKKLKFIHIAGTNGKGSTAAMLANVLRAAGYRTGLYTSPYIIRFNERMQIDNEPISDGELAEITTRVQPLADALDEHPTEFELVTCIAMEYFARHACDIVVLEVGLGGEFDSTNVIPAPEAAVIVNIGLDHMQVLGDTVEEIAHAKAGIIKDGCDCVLYAQQPSVEAVFEQTCRERGARLHRAGMEPLTLVSHGLDGQVFDWKTLGGLHIPLLGEHQLHNASTVLTTLEVLAAKGWTIPESAVREGLSSVRWPGRFELLARDPLFIIDGGHNPQCLDALVQAFRDYLPGRKITFLNGCMADKDYGAMFADLVPFAAGFVTVTPGNPRALPAERLAEHLKPYGLPVTACKSIAEGVRTAIEFAGRDGVVCACGSLYMLADVCEAVASAYGQDK